MLGYKTKRYFHSSLPPATHQVYLPLVGEKTTHQVYSMLCMWPMWWKHKGWALKPTKGWWEGDNWGKGLLDKIERMQGISQGTVPDETGKEGTRWRRTLNVLSKRLNYSPEATESVMGLKHESDIISFAFYLGHLAAVWSLDWWERWKAAKADKRLFQWSH